MRAFGRAGETLAGAGVNVAALSVDDKETTAALVAKHKLTLPEHEEHHGYVTVSPPVLLGARKIEASA